MQAAAEAVQALQTAAEQAASALEALQTAAEQAASELQTLQTAKEQAASELQALKTAAEQAASELEALQTAAKTAAVHSSQGSRGYVPGQPRSIADEGRNRGQAAKARTKATLRPMAAAASAASILDGIGVPSQAAATVSRTSGGGTWTRETAALTRTLLFSVPPQTTVPEDFLHNLSDEDMVQCAVELRRAAEERVVERLHRGHGLESIARMADLMIHRGHGLESIGVPVPDGRDEA